MKHTYICISDRTAHRKISLNALDLGLACFILLPGRLGLIVQERPVRVHLSEPSVTQCYWVCPLTSFYRPSSLMQSVLKLFCLPSYANYAAQGRIVAMNIRIKFKANPSPFLTLAVSPIHFPDVPAPKSN